RTGARPDKPTIWRVPTTWSYTGQAGTAGRLSVVPGLADGVGEPRPRALDLRGLGTRRLQLGRVGAPRGRVPEHRAALTTRSYEGVPAMADIRRNWLRAWRNFHADADGYHEVDGERVLVLLRYASQSGRSKYSRQGLGLGHTKREIAELLGLSVRSAEPHRFDIQQKLL